MSKERIELITQKLEQAFTVDQMHIEDDSAKHAGHAGAATGMGHFNLTISAAEFEGVNTLRCHRMIYAALGDLMETDIHALSIRASAPTN